MAIPSITTLTPRIGGASPAAAHTQDGSPAGSFADALKGLVENTDKSAEEANVAVSGMLDKSVDVHDAMIALQRAEMSLQFTVQIRNKLVQAYQDIMRMPV
jgi:flagellar hook-basal body complex protein FliE